MADAPGQQAASHGHGPLGFEPLVPYERTFDGLYGLEPVGQGLGEDGTLRGRVRVRPELLGAEEPAARRRAGRDRRGAGLAGDRAGHDRSGLMPSGLSNDTTVIAAVGVGTMLHAEATPLSRVEDYWVWSVQLRDDAGTLCAFSRVTIAVRPLRR